MPTYDRPDVSVAEPAEVRPRRALLVEDDADQREMIAWMVRAEGWEVVSAASGVELLEWISIATSRPDRALFDAIVLDVGLPDISGPEAVGAWRFGEWPIPFILVTASPDEAVHRDARMLGAVAVLPKPLVRDALRDGLDRALAAAHASAA